MTLQKVFIENMC